MSKNKRENRTMVFGGRRHGARDESFMTCVPSFLRTEYFGKHPSSVCTRGRWRAQKAVFTLLLSLDAALDSLLFSNAHT